MSDKLLLGGELRRTENANSEVNIDSDKNFNERIWVPNVTIKIREKHTVSSVMRIVKNKTPNVLTLTSTNFKLNDDVINFCGLLISKGWKITDTIIFPDANNKKYLIKISPFSHSSIPVRRIQKNNEGCKASDGEEGKIGERGGDIQINKRS